MSVNYDDAVKHYVQLQALIYKWDKCPPVELGIRVMAIARYGMFNVVPQNIFTEWEKMFAKWQRVRLGGADVRPLA